jgi:uncharacterized membrane protein
LGISPSVNFSLGSLITSCVFAWTIKFLIEYFWHWLKRPCSAINWNIKYIVE